MMKFLTRLLPPYGSHTVFGIATYSNIDKFWFRFIIAYHEYILQKIDVAYYYIIHRTVFRHHIVKTTLKPGFYDIDDVMFHACFALLGRFVENELGRSSKTDSYRGYRIDNFCNKQTGNDDKKAIDLWLWYLYTNLNNVADQEAVKGEKLQKLIDIRTSLWT
jgi:hypothetical protein